MCRASVILRCEIISFSEQLFRIGCGFQVHSMYSNGKLFQLTQADLSEEIEEVERAKNDAQRLRSRLSIRDEDDDSDDDSQSGRKKGGIAYEEFIV